MYGFAQCRLSFNGHYTTIYFYPCVLSSVLLYYYKDFRVIVLIILYRIALPTLCPMSYQRSASGLVLTQDKSSRYALGSIHNRILKHYKEYGHYVCTIASKFV